MTGDAYWLSLDGGRDWERGVVRSVRCEVCGIWTSDPHEPHDRGCINGAGKTWPNGDCTCDHIVCSGCCWDCKP
jgi:hypothetical protein